MRDLTTAEIQHVYGAGSSYSPQQKRNNNKNASRETNKRDTRVAKNTRNSQRNNSKKYA